MLHKRVLSGKSRSPAIGSLLQSAIPFASALMVFILYAFTLEDDISWAYFGGDGGELIAASYSLGIPHPPGFPTYVLLGKLFSIIPVGPIAFRYNLFSAVSMATAAGFVSAIAAKKSFLPLTNIRAILPLALACVACGLTYAFVPVVWHQSLIAEVYALNALLLAALLWALLTDRRPVLIGFLFGLSITGHLTSILFVPLLLLMVPKKSLPGMAVGTAMGLLPLLVLPILYNSGSPISWGQPNNIKGWWWLVSGQLYRPNVFSISPSLWPTRMAGWGAVTFLPLMILTFATIVGLLADGPKDRKRPGSIILGTAILFVSYALAYNTPDSFVYLIPAILLLSVNLGLFLPRIKVLVLFLSLLMLVLVIPSNSASATIDVRAAAEERLAVAPENAILLTEGDQTVAALWYFQYVEGVRLDIAIVDENMFQFPWYRRRLHDTYPYLTSLEEDDVPGFVKSNQRDRPVCRVSFVGQGHYSCVDSTEKRDS